MSLLAVLRQGKPQSGFQETADWTGTNTFNSPPLIPNDSSSSSLTFHSHIRIYRYTLHVFLVIHRRQRPLRLSVHRRLASHRGSRSLRLGTNGFPRTIHRTNFTEIALLSTPRSFHRPLITPSTTHILLKLAKHMRWDKRTPCMRSVLLEQKKNWVVRFGPCCGPK